ncbi:hypothetical protein D3C84_1044100 [compost metagenome]
MIAATRSQCSTNRSAAARAAGDGWVLPTRARNHCGSTVAASGNAWSESNSASAVYLPAVRSAEQNTGTPNAKAVIAKW